MLSSKLEKSVLKIRQLPITEHRKEELEVLVKYVSQKLKSKQPILLNFICTHNSRRSQFAQVWGQVASSYFKIPAKCYSGGVEITAFNPRAIKSLVSSGFKVEGSDGENPIYEIEFSQYQKAILGFSKRYDDPSSAKEGFAAIMTCDHADENCPIIPGAEKRISLRYEDPKAFDNTDIEEEKYEERSHQIASELFYVFEIVAQNRGAED
ncbi:low molecular weight phosphatase family protein [Algoriphagus machipongonensis]|uniref:Protein-tyrosine-phosphatase n=1 Tax=Algoriphagus machipongonensis TaxID=388413 RepID=A3I2X0_9BACT|nr:hypothetical protein [Algoriphagus machipongonensis]EAZ79169.1 protein-tyrosine-phosphatase [Algoriphagus machipongonensis]